MEGLTMSIFDEENASEWDSRKAEIVAGPHADCEACDGTGEGYARSPRGCLNCNGMGVVASGEIPACASSMGCFCALHAVGAPAKMACNANEAMARAYAEGR